MDLCGQQVMYDAAERTLHCGNSVVPLEAEKGRIELIIFRDRTSIEIYGQSGSFYYVEGALWNGETELALRRIGAVALLVLEEYDLGSIWENENEA